MNSPRRRLGRPKNKAVVLTLDPNKLTEKKQRRFHISNLQSFYPLIALHNQSSPVRAQAVDYSWKERYPPDSAAFLYYFSPPGKPRIAGELRLRVASSDDHASFESGSDLMIPNGQPWSRSLYQVSKRYLSLYEKLREEGLVPDELDPVLSTLPSKVPRCQLLYTLNDTFIIDFSYFLQSFFVITEQGVASLRLHGPCVERHSTGKFRTPYTGSALARFERSPLPEHKGTRTVLLRFLKMITPVKCVIPNYDGPIRQPKERELHRRSSRTSSRLKLHPPAWSLNIDKKSGKMGGIKLLWDA